jgi:acyl-homoserine-lactone acylase
VAVVGFNRHAGWGRTVNTIDTVDFFKLTVQNGQYLYDGQPRAFERSTKTLKIKEADGSFKEESLEILKTIHGPVVYDQDGLMVAMRVAGLDRPRMLEQWFRMGEATDLESFTNALRMMSVPMWHANYADDKGHLMFVFDGLVPKRNGHDYTTGRRSSPAIRRRRCGLLSFDELPKVIDPAVVGPRTRTSRHGMPAAAARSHEMTRHTSHLPATRCRRCARSDRAA